MMEKYIKESLFRELVIPTINETFKTEETLRLTLVGIIEASLKILPASDVVEVIRCGECRCAIDSDGTWLSGKLKTKLNNPIEYCLKQTKLDEDNDGRDD